MTVDKARSTVAELFWVVNRPRHPFRKGKYEVPATPEVVGFLLLFRKVVPTRRRILRVSPAELRILYMFGVLGPPLTASRLARCPNYSRDDHARDLLAVAPLAARLAPVARELVAALERERNPFRRRDLLVRLRREVIAPWNAAVEALPSLPPLCAWCGRPLFRRSWERTPERDRPPRWCSATCRNRFRSDGFDV